MSYAGQNLSSDITAVNTFALVVTRDKKPVNITLAITAW